MNRSSIFYSALFILLLSSCARSDESDPVHSFRIYSEEGVTVAETSGGPKYSSEIFAYEKVLEIRGYPSEERSYLVRPRSPSVDADGYLYVPDVNDNRIVVYSPDGRFVREFGQAGEGPGDLQLPTHVQLVGDRVVVTSGIVSAGVAYRQRMTSFTRTGRLLDVYIEDLSRALRSHLYYLTTSGERVATWWENRTRDGFAYEKAGGIVETTSGDTLASFGSPDVVVGKQITDEFQGRIRTRTERYLFTARPHLLFLPPDWIALSDGNRQLLRIFDLRGNLVRDIRPGIAREPITREDREGLLALYDEKLHQLQGYTERTGDSFEYDITENAKENLLFPEYKAMWDLPRFDDAGFFWLRIPEERPFDVYENQSDRYRVISPQGEYLGDTEWPPVTEALIQRGHILAIVTDPDTNEGIPTVFRVISAAAGLRYPN